MILYLESYTKAAQRIWERSSFSGHFPGHQVPHSVLRRKTPRAPSNDVEGSKSGCLLTWDFSWGQDPPSEWTESQGSAMGMLGVSNGETAGKQGTQPSVSMEGSWLGTVPASAEPRPTPHTSAHFTTLCLRFPPLSNPCPETLVPLSPVATCESERLKLHICLEIRYLKVSLSPSTAGFLGHDVQWQRPTGTGCSVLRRHVPSGWFSTPWTWDSPKSSIPNVPSHTCSSLSPPYPHYSEKLESSTVG